MLFTRVCIASLFASFVCSAPLQTRQTCYSGVYMIVARGSDEAPGDGSPGVVASAVAAQLPGSGSVAVSYPASILVPPYPSSVTDGIKATITLIQNYVNACGARSKIALIGYSQGANVMTDTLAGGVDKPTPISRSYSKYNDDGMLSVVPADMVPVTAVTVFGDPTFTANQTFDRGSATTNGIFARSQGGSSLALLNTYASVLQSYCNAGDEFCASGDNATVHEEEVADFKSAAVAFIVAKNS